MAGMVPVFLFSGFLGSGKTTLINDLLESNGIARVKTLAILTEKGETPLSVPEEYKKLITVCYIKDKADLNPERLAQMQRETGAVQILFEYNGMWLISEMFNALPRGWMLYNVLLTADAESFLFYNLNMRNLAADKLRTCSMVMYNRVSAQGAAPEFRRLVRALNRKAEIYYEYISGESEKDESGDDLPYDLAADHLVIEDDAFAIWQLDLKSFPAKYNGKTVKVRMQVYPGSMAGRRVMTCCEADIEQIQFHIVDDKWLLPDVGSWVDMTAEIDSGEQMIRLKLISAEQTLKPEHETAVF